MRQTSGVILNNDIFINSSHVVKVEKKNTDVIEVYMLGVASPVVLTFDNEKDKKGNIITTAECCRDVAFNKIIMEMYGHNYAILKFDTK